MKQKNKFKIYAWMAMKMLTYYIKSITYDHGEYFTFTDLFGEMVGGLLLDKVTYFIIVRFNEIIKQRGVM